MSGDEEKKKPAGRQVGGIRSQYATLGGGPKPIEPLAASAVKQESVNTVLPQSDNPVIPQKDIAVKQESSIAAIRQSANTVLPQNDNAVLQESGFAVKPQSDIEGLPQNGNEAKQQKRTKTEERVKLTFYVDSEDVRRFDELRYQYNRDHETRLDQNKFMRLIMKRIDLYMLEELEER